MDASTALDGTSIADLVERFRSSGDEACFAELYRRTRRRVFGVAFRVLHDAAAAEEVCHDAFLRAFERFASLRGVEFTAWVCRIAGNLALNVRRHRTVAERTEAGLPPPPPALGVEREAITRQEVAIAEEVLASLREEHRHVLLLRHVDGCSHDEIIGLTGYTAEQVRSHLQNARRNFAILWRRRTEGGLTTDGR
jgi:RNA polymerase sigma-70 factor (ECF subfamily)